MSVQTPLAFGISRFVPSSMRYGQFRYYWLALLTGVTGHQMLFQFTLGWLMFQLTGDEGYLGYLGLAIALPALALNLVGGVLADRLEPKVLVATAQSASATVVVGLAVLVMLERVEPWHILLAAFIAGVGQAFDQPSRASIFPRLVDREHIVNAVAMESVVWNGVRVLAPALAGMVIARLSIETSMLISAASFYVLAAVMSILRLRERPPARGGVMQQIGEAFRYIGRNPIFLYVMLMTFCNSLFGISYILLMPSLAEKWLMVGAERVGWLLGAAGAGAIVGNWIIGSVPSNSPRGLLILFGAVLYGICLILFSVAAWFGHYWISMGILFIAGINFSLYLVGGLSTLQELVPDNIRGRVMGLYGATWSLGPLGMAQAGFVARYLGAPVAVGIGAVVVLLVAVLIFVFRSDLRNFRGRQPESVAAEPART
ncbi:MAG: MFS transporter [Chloroflexota bacterium]|nr:MFS transporter [Chloroflexota bacterium]